MAGNPEAAYQTKDYRYNADTIFRKLSSYLVGTSFNNDTIIQKNTITQIGDNIISKNTDLSIYPNPSSGDLTIKYDVAQRSNVKIDIYDIKGILIKTIIDTQNQHTGKYQIPVNLTELPSGIYIVNLINNEKRFSEKLVIEK